MSIIALIVARAKNGVIGRNNQLPWRLPQDLQYFKQVTMNKPIIMGRKTWESLGRPLPGRDNIVISRNPDFFPDGAVAVNDLETAIALGEMYCAQRGVDEMMIIGGEQIYRAALPHVQRAYITEVDAEVAGDAHFPALPGDWQQVSETVHAACADNPYPYRFTMWQRQQ